MWIRTWRLRIKRPWPRASPTSMRTSSLVCPDPPPRPPPIFQGCADCALGTGSQPTGVTCKSIATQINDFLAAVDGAGIKPAHLWLDIEPTSTAAGDACNAWQLGSAGNEALAKQWVAAIKGTGRKWGIYANALVLMPLFPCWMGILGKEKIRVQVLMT